MNAKRMKLVFKIISLAMEVGKGEIVKQVVAYGIHFKLTPQEVREVLKMPITEIYNKVHSFKQQEKKKVYIPDPYETGPAPERVGAEEM